MIDNYSNSSRLENRGYTSNQDVKTIGRMIGNMLDDKKLIEEQNKKQKERAIKIQREKGLTPLLTYLGKLSGFVEHFDGITLDDQEIFPIDEIQNPKDTESFINGYNFAKILIEKGMTEENYRDFVESNESKFNINCKKHR